MAGRHRKPNTSTSAVTAAKIAVTGAVLGSSSLALTNQASAASDNKWDQAAHCESVGNSGAQWPVCGAPRWGATPHNVPAGAPARGATPITNPGVNDVSAPPLEAPPPTDAPLSAPDPAEDVTPPPPEEAAVVDTAPEPPQPMDAPVAVPQPAELDVAPAPDNQPPPPPQPDPPTDMADAPAAGPVDDTTKETQLVTLVHQFSGTPYIWGGDSPAGTDCSGLASWLANLATGRPVFGDRFDTSSEESALLARGFQYGTAPGALVIGWNNHHTAVTLADGTPVSSGEGGGIRIGGSGAYEPQFTHHMFLRIAPEGVDADPAPADAPAVIEMMNSQVPPPEPSAAPNGDAAI
jgi:cell wall-associated NlpC family hydrolase